MYHFKKHLSLVKTASGRVLRSAKRQNEGDQRRQASSEADVEAFYAAMREAATDPSSSAGLPTPPLVRTAFEDSDDNCSSDGDLRDELEKVTKEAAKAKKERKKLKAQSPTKKSKTPKNKSNNNSEEEEDRSNVNQDGSNSDSADADLSQEQLEKDHPYVVALEERIEWLESERVRLLRLTRNKASRRLSLQQRQQEEDERMLQEQLNTHHDDQEEADATGSARKRSVRKPKRGVKHEVKTTPKKAVSDMQATTQSFKQRARARRSMDGKGVWERAEKHFNVTLKLTPNDLPLCTFCDALGIRLENDEDLGNRLVITEFISDKNGNPKALEACGHVGVDDILTGIKGMRVYSEADIEAALAKLPKDEPLIIDFCRKLSKQLASGDPESLEQANERIAFLEKELKFARAEYARLDIGALESLEDILRDTRSQNTKLQQDLSKLKVVEQEWLADQGLRNRYELKARECRRLLNTLIDLKGAIRIFVRVRPPKIDDLAEVDANKTVLQFPENRLLQLSDMDSVDVPEKSWEFDAVFNPKSTQTEVFAEVEPLVYSVVDGYNACVFAYGQTGSGKTYTMDGPENDRGVWYRSTSALFDILAQRQAETPEYERVTFSVKASVLEIYQERVRDLLAITAMQGGVLLPDDDTESKDGESTDGTDNAQSTRRLRKAKPFSLEIKHHPKTGYVYVQDAVEQTVTCAEDLHRIIELGKKQRQVGVTNMNEHSSRSHMVLLIQVSTKLYDANAGPNAAPKYEAHSKLQLIDLAGSEKASNVEGERLRETCYINKSLSALGDVMHALQSNDSRHIPFRNSKLTSLLRDSLGGKAKTLMIVQVSPQKRNMLESIRSLDFGQRVGKICLQDNAKGPAKRGDKADQISRLKRENADLSSESDKLKNRVLDLKQKLDQERQAKHSVEASCKNFQSMATTEKQRIADLESEVHILSKQLKEAARKQDENWNINSGTTEESKQGSPQTLRERHVDLRKKYKEAMQRIEMLEKAQPSATKNRTQSARVPSTLPKSRPLSSATPTPRKTLVNNNSSTPLSARTLTPSTIDRTPQRGRRIPVSSQQEETV